jgi:putative DNA primase/helicase
LARRLRQGPDAQRVHAGIYDDSIRQGYGRARGLNRTAANPVTVYLRANAPPCDPVASIGRWRPTSRLAKMLLRGMAPLGAADRRRCYPDLYPSEDAARQDKRRNGGEIEEIAALRRLADCMPWASALVSWQPAGQGHKAQRRVVARERLAETRAEALREFGGLVSWHVETFSRGCRPVALAEDRDMTGKEALFPTMSHSLAAATAAPRPIGASTSPRGPPD